MIPADLPTGEKRRGHITFKSESARAGFSKGSGLHQASVESQQRQNTNEQVAAVAGDADKQLYSSQEPSVPQSEEHERMLAEAS